MSILTGSILNSIPVPIKKDTVISSPAPPAPSGPGGVSTGLELWYKADAIVGFNDGDSLTSWVDSSGNGRNATTVVGKAVPTYETNRINSLPAANFPLHASLTSGYAVANPFTVFVVFNCTQLGGAFRRTVQGSNNWLIGPYNVNYQYYNGAFIAGPSYVQNAWVYVTATQVNPGGAVFRVDGSEAGTNANTTAPGTFFMGAGGFVDESVMGDIAEIAVYSRVLNAGEISTVETYLVGKYGL